MPTCAEIEREWDAVTANLREQFGLPMAGKLSQIVLRMLANEQQYMDRLDMTPTECKAIHEALAKGNELLASINARDVKPAFSHG